MSNFEWNSYLGENLLASAMGVNGSNIIAADGFLHTYHADHRIDWRLIHSIAIGRDNSVTPFTRPYWINGKPMSNLALLGVQARERIASDPDTSPHALIFMATDPNVKVRNQVHLNPNTSQEARNILVGNAPHPVAVASGVQQQQDQSRKKKSRFGIGAAIVTALLLIIGFSSGYSFEVVDQEKRPDTLSEALTGNFNIEETSTQICGQDEDYLSCINQHVAVFNSVCVGHYLTVRANQKCDALDDFIEGTKDEYDRCGAGCFTIANDEGLWGWPYLEAVPETEMVSNNDGRPEITHTEHCRFNLGPIKIGSCPR